MLRVLTDTSIRGRARTVVAAIPEPTGPGVAGSTGNHRFHERGQRHPHLGLGVDHVGRTVDDRRAVVNGVVEGRPRSRPATSWAFVPSVSKPYGPDLRVALVAGDVSTTTSRLDGRHDRPHGHRPRGTTPPGLPASTSGCRSARRRRRLVPPGAWFRLASDPGIRVTVSGLPEAAIPHLAAALADAVGGERAARLGGFSPEPATAGPADVSAAFPAGCRECTTTCGC